MSACCPSSSFFFFNDTATTEIYTLSLHDALPICGQHRADADHHRLRPLRDRRGRRPRGIQGGRGRRHHAPAAPAIIRDRKSTRLNSSHSQISYAVFCLKKKKSNNNKSTQRLTTYA